jgi:hypothetical protein
MFVMWRAEIAESGGWFRPSLCPGESEPEAVVAVGGAGDFVIRKNEPIGGGIEQ